MGSTPSVRLLRELPVPTSLRQSRRRALGAHVTRAFPAAWWLVLASALATLCGCSAVPFGRLAGSNDAALEYAVDPDPATDPRVVAAGVKARLGSAQVMADVEATDAGRVRVVVDGDLAGVVDDLLVWRGGLRALRVEDAYALAPPDTTGLRPMNARGPDGDERWWQGAGDAVARAVRETKLDGGHVAFAERVPGSSEWRTRVAIVPALVVLGLGDAPFQSITPVSRGRALAIGMPPEARAAIAVERDSHPRALIALARGRVLLATLPIDEALATPMVLPFGEDITAYTRAYHSRLLLRSPILPPMHRVSVTALPARRGLAAACALLPFALSFAWLFFLRRFDRTRPEPVWLVAATFALGGVAIVPAALVEIALGNLSPWLDPGLATLGGQAWALPLSIPVYTLSVGAVEETAKFVAAWSLARHRREFDEPVDGIIYACAASLGFAAVENVKYFALGRMSGVVIAMRAFETVPAHMFFSAIWGYAMGRTLVSRRARVLPYLALAAVAHGTFDAIVSTDGMPFVPAMLVLVLAFGFIAALRRSLRHGAVPVRGPVAGAPPTEPFPLSTMPRSYFRIGSLAAFYGCAAGMIACAFALTIVGTAYELLHHRVGIVFVVLASAMLALFGLAAYGTSATIPLDVAIDAQGITFAGGCTRWSAIVSYDVEPGRRSAYVRLQTAEGVTRLGPARLDVAEDIVDAIRAARG
jgi:RsiW-degrading membrane proteinase PrsW (M82 family)